MGLEARAAGAAGEGEEGGGSEGDEERGEVEGVVASGGVALAEHAGDVGLAVGRRAGERRPKFVEEPTRSARVDDGPREGVLVVLGAGEDGIIVVELDLEESGEGVSKEGEVLEGPEDRGERICAKVER